MKTLYIIYIKGCYSVEDSIDSYWLNKDSMNEYLVESAKKWPALYSEGRYYIEEDEVHE